MTSFFKKKFVGAILVIAPILFFISISYSLEIPPPPSARVNDYAGLLDSHSKMELEEKLADFEKETSNQMVVATFPSLEGDSLEDFSIRLAEKWKVGEKGRDNGVILLVFKNDHKLRIEVGYGLEGALPDATSNLIIRNEIAPHFKEGDFKAGIFAGVAAIMAATKGEYQATESSPPFNLLIVALVIFLWLAFIFILKKGKKEATYSSTGLFLGGLSGGWGGFGRGGGWSGGGGFSGGGGGFGGGGSSGSW